MYRRRLIFAVFICLLGFQAPAQLGVGITYGLDFYQHLKNPIDTSQARSVGSALINLNIGPKIWLGLKDVSLSLEAQASYAPFAHDTDVYKGMGALSFPVLAQLNIGGLSTLKKNGGLGASIGAGTTLFLTDLYFRADEFSDLNLQLNQVIFGQVAVGFGTDGVAAYIYARYGEGERSAHAWNFGAMVDYNLSTRAKIRNGKW